MFQIAMLHKGSTLNQSATLFWTEYSNDQANINKSSWSTKFNMQGIFIS